MKVSLEEQHLTKSQVSEAKKRALAQKHREEREDQYGEAEGGEQSQENVTLNSPLSIPNRDVQHV